jgi:hypothetical protein
VDLDAAGEEVRIEERGETVTQVPLALQHGSDREEERGTCFIQRREHNECLVLCSDLRPRDIRPFGIECFWN